MSKSRKSAPRKKVDLGLFCHRLGHRFAISLLAGYTVNVCKDIEIRINPGPFCTSCKISSINKKARSKNPLNPKAPFK